MREAEAGNRESGVQVLYSVQYRVVRSFLSKLHMRDCD